MIRFPVTTSMALVTMRYSRIVQSQQPTLLRTLSRPPQASFEHRGNVNITTLVQGFGKHIRELKAPDYKESQVRRHYIDPFWKLLGWDVDNEEQRAPQDVE